MKLPDLVQPSESIANTYDVEQVRIISFNDLRKAKPNSFGYVSTKCLNPFMYIMIVWGKGTDGLEDG